MAEQNQLGQRLNELWNPNCGVTNGTVPVRVTVQISPTGRLMGPPQAEGLNSDDMVVRVNAERAVRAFRRAEALGYLPINLRVSAYTVNFNPRNVCG